jgi:hypothetical protein
MGVLGDGLARGLQLDQIFDQALAGRSARDQVRAPEVPPATSKLRSPGSARSWR